MTYNHNQVQLSGRIATDPELIFTTDGTPKATLILLQDRPERTSEPAPPHRFVLVGLNALAQQLHESIRPNDRLFVTGKLRARTFTANGRRQERLEVHLDQFVQLKSARSARRQRLSRNRTTGLETAFGRE